MATVDPSTGKKKFGKTVGPGLVGAGLEVGISMLAFRGEMGTKAAIGRGLVEFAAWQTAPWLMGIATLGSLAGMAVPSLMERHDNQKSKFNTYYRPNVGGTYKDTQQASTMRQASIQAMSAHKMNARTALGNEARLMARY